MQERCNSIAITQEFRLSCTKPSIWIQQDNNHKGRKNTAGLWELHPPTRKTYLTLTRVLMRCLLWITCPNVRWKLWWEIMVYYNCEFNGRALRPVMRDHFDGLVQERRNSSVLAKAMELRLSCTNPSILCMCPANERQRYIVTSLIGRAHSQNDPWTNNHCINSTKAPAAIILPNSRGDFSLWQLPISSR